MYVRNLSGTEYVLQATTTHDSEISGNQTLSLTVLPTKANNAFIRDIAEMWVITDDNDVVHKVVYASRRGVGDMLTVDIKAVPLFFDDFDNLRIYEEYNRHMTAMAAFTLIFADTGYNFVLHGSHDSIEWEGFGGGESRLETFKRALNRYGAEFEISGNTVHLKPLIGRDTQFQYRHRLNASNIVQEIDASGFWTYAKGYGNYGDGEGGGEWEDAKLIREYTSPLAQIPGIGLRHAPPIKDGRVSVVSAMDKALKTHVDESLKVSVTTDIHDLRKQGYALAQPELGDRVFLTDERIGFDAEVRVVAMSITKDWRGNVTHFSITIGDEGVTKRHMSGMKTAIDNITNLIAGKQKLPNSVLDNAILQATKALQDAQTELTFGSNGILAIDKDDPNYVTILNSKGVGVSIDGGATFGEAITGRGINASYIAVGTLQGIRLEGNEIIGGTITGGRIVGGSFFNEGTDGNVAIANGRISATNFFTHDGGVFSAVTGNSVLRSYDNFVYLQTPTEVRVTAPRTSADYTNLRAWDIFAERRFYSRGGEFIGSNDTVFGSDNGFVMLRTKSFSAPIYLQGGGVFATRPGDPSTYVRITGNTIKSMNGVFSGTGNTNFESSSGNVALKASSNGYPVYLQGLEIKAVKVSDAGEYIPVRAASFPTQSSGAYKTNIGLFDGDVIGMLKDVSIYTYHLQSNVDSMIFDKPKIGMISEATLPIFRDEDGVDPYTITSFLFSVCQKQQDQIEGLTTRLNDIETIL